MRDSGHPAPFIVGVARSGTTLLRLMLDAHPALAIPPETHFLPQVVRAGRKGGGPAEMTDAITEHRRWPDFGLDEAELRTRAAGAADASEVLRAFFGLYAEGQGKKRWGDKSTNYIRKLRLVEKTLPEAVFVHLIRDGRDTALSQVKVHFGPDNIADAAAKWRDEIAGAREIGPTLGRYAEFRYEDLVADPEPVLREICSLAELEWDDAVLNYRKGAAERVAEINRDLTGGSGPHVTAEQRAAHQSAVSEPLDPDRPGWREKMSAADVATFEGVAGGMLRELGYEL